MPPTTSDKKRWEIVFLSTHPLGPKLSQPKIAKYTSTSLSTVQFWLRRYRETGGVSDLPHTGRPPMLSEKEDAILEKFIEKNPDATSPMLSDKLKRHNIEISARSVRRRLNQTGLVFGNTMLKPLLSEKHCAKRLVWAKQNQERDWNQVLFTDETTINVNVRRKKVWHKPGKKLVIRTVKHPTKVHIWGCLSSVGFGNCYVFSENLNADLLLKIYSKALKPSILKLYGSTDCCVLQEDNDPKHTSKKAALWRADNNVERMNWPAQSPDQNCIENVWHVLKVRVSQRHPKNLKDLVRAIKTEWRGLSVEYAQKLVESMPKRVQALIDAKGDYTMY
jgi:transposase